MNTDHDVLDVSVGSIYGAHTRKGLVHLRIGPSEALLEPAKARDIAALLLESAEAAQADEFLMAFLQTHVQMPLDQATIVLEAFRKARAAAPAGQRAHPRDAPTAL